MRLETSVWINAPRVRVFDLARDVDVHATTTADSGERVVSRTGTGLLELDDEVTFEARHLGVRQRLTSKIVEIDPPTRFVDEMQRGAFKSMRHEHVFAEEADGTRMTDILYFEAPFGLLGSAVSHTFLGAYMVRFLEKRGLQLKRLAETAQDA